MRTEIVPGLQSSLSVWRLNMASELLYVGDEGTTEASRPSRRRGIEWSTRWAPRHWLLIDADLAWTHARFADDLPEGRRIPGAVERVASVAVSVHDLGPWTGSLQWRVLGSRPLREDNAVRSGASVLTNLRLGYALSRRSQLTLDVFNLADRRVNDIEYWASSRLAGEADAVEDRMLHPAEPRTVRLTWRYTW